MFPPRKKKIRLRILGFERLLLLYTHMKMFGKYCSWEMKVENGERKRGRLAGGEDDYTDIEAVD